MSQLLLSAFTHSCALELLVVVRDAVCFRFKENRMKNECITSKWPKRHMAKGRNAKPMGIRK